MNKKLYRSKNNVKISGVCGGIAEYFKWMLPLCVCFGCWEHC